MERLQIYCVRVSTFHVIQLMMQFSYSNNVRNQQTFRHNRKNGEIHLVGNSEY
jgi:hypothetical protein